MPQALAPVLTFGAALLAGIGGQSMASGRLFASLLLLKLLTQPLIQLFQAVPILVSAIGCVGRIQKFACSDERVDMRSRPSLDQESTLSVTEKVNSRAEISKEVTRSEDLHPLKNTNCAVQTVGASFGWCINDTETKPVATNINLSLQIGRAHV